MNYRAIYNKCNKRQGKYFSDIPEMVKDFLSHYYYLGGRKNFYKEVAI